MKQTTYKLNSEEKRLLNSSPMDAQKAIDLAYIAGGITGLLFQLDFHNNNGDAFRHCLWTCLIAKETSVSWAQKWTTAHESSSPPEGLSRKMDEYNNNKGIEIFSQNTQSSTAQIIQKCLIAIQNGELKEIKNQALVPTNLTNNLTQNIFLAINQRIVSFIEFMVEFCKTESLKKDQDGNNALHDCIIKDFQTGFNILVDIIDVNQTGAFGKSALMICSQYEHGFKYTNILIQKGANPNYQEPHYFETALMIAASNGNQKVVEALLPFSNKKLRSKNGRTAYDCAITENYLDIANLLII
jgi:hypothetical protein